MESPELAVRKAIHLLNVSDDDRLRPVLDLFRAQTQTAARVRIVQVLISTCDIIPDSYSVAGMAISSMLVTDFDSVHLALHDTVLLYPLIESSDNEVCGRALFEYIQALSAKGLPVASISLQVFRHLLRRFKTKSASGVEYCGARVFLCRLWADFPASIPPHLEGIPTIRICAKWLTTSPSLSGEDKPYLLRIIKTTLKPSTPTESAVVLVTCIVNEAFKSLHDHDSRAYYPEHLQFLIPLIDCEVLPTALYAILESVPGDRIIELWAILQSWPLIIPSNDPGVRFSKSMFSGSLYPILGFLNAFIRIAVKLLSASTKLDWRMYTETFLRIASAKLTDPVTAADACELLQYLLKLEVPQRPLPSLLRAGTEKDMVPVVEAILSLAETSFNRFSTKLFTPENQQQLNRPLEFLNSLIRTLQNDILIVQQNKGLVPLSSSLSLSLPTGALEVARLASIGSDRVANVLSSIVPHGSTTAGLLQPLPPPQTSFIPNQALVPAIAPTSSLSAYPTGTGVEVIARADKFAGIQNFNNTCYLSSFLQVLFLTDGFCCSVFGFSLRKGEKTEEADFVQGAKIIPGLQLLFTRLLRTQHQYIEISEFIRSLPPSYRSGEQQDVTESGRWIFDKIGGTDQSLVSSVFGGEMLHKTKCLACNTVSERKEVFTDLCVSVPKQAEVLGKKRVTVQSLVKRMLKPESLTGDNKYSCDTCGKKQDASRWIELTQLPNHLMLVMHKFSFDVKTCDFKKETTAVHPDDGSIDLVGTRYELYASVLHCGESAMKGHYVALGKRSGRSSDHVQSWALMDDSNVTMLSESEAMERISGLHSPTDSAYVLLLKSVKAPAAVNPKIPQQMIDEAQAIEAAAVHL